MGDRSCSVQSTVSNRDSEWDEWNCLACFVCGCVMRIFFFSSHSILGKKSFSILFHNRIGLPVFENYLCKDSF